MKIKTKAQMNWEIGREQEKLFREQIEEIVGGIDVDELFRLIRGTEYRRGKEDGRKEYEKELNYSTIELALRICINPNSSKPNNPKFIKQIEEQIELIKERRDAKESNGGGKK